MNFEDIQVAWDTQSQRPIFRFCEAALIASVKERARRLEWFVGFFEWAMTLNLVFITAMCLRDPILQGHDWYLALPALACLSGVTFVWTGRQNRLRGNMRYDASLLGMIEKTIAQIDYHVGRLRSIQWWCIAPLSLTLLVGFLLVDDSKKYLFYFVFGPLFLFFMGLALWGIRREIHRKLLPQKSEYEALRSKLLDL